MSAPASVLSRPSAGVLWSAALGLLLIVAISLFGLGLRGTAELDRMVDRDLEALVIAHEEGGPERAQGLIEELQANRFALLPDFSGRIATLAEAGSLGLDARVSERGTAELSGERSRARAVLVTEGRAIVAARSLAPLRSELIQLALVLLAAAGAAMALAWTLVERSRRKLARRVDALAGAMRDTVRLGGAPDLPASDANDELDYVARTAGDMARGLVQRADAHRAFSEQLAHELRTPLSRLSSSLPDDGSDDGDEATGTVRARILEVSQALGDMLELASIRNDAINMESGMGSRTLQPGSPAEIVREVAEMFEDVADEAGVTLSVHAQEKTRLPLDAGQFRRLCVNLIDNALQHAPSGHPVEIAVQPTEKTILRVSNPGQFPAKLTEAGPQRFETFGQDGTGLGLAFADAIAGYHGWSLHLSNQDGHAVASVEAA